MEDKRKTLPAARTQSQTGFTAIELAIVLVILAILVVLAVPSFNSLAVRNRVRSASFDLVTGLMLARSEAIKRGRNVTVAAASSSAWQQGWNVSVPYVSAPGNPAVTLFLTKQDAYPSITITGSASSLIYGPTGRLTAGAVSMTVAPSSADSAIESRCISVDLSGMPRSRPGACA